MSVSRVVVWSYGLHPLPEIVIYCQKLGTRTVKTQLSIGLEDTSMEASNNPDSARDDELDELICDCLELLLAALPADQAHIIRAVDLEGSLPESVAEAQGLFLRDVMARLAPGRKGLKGVFGKMYMICPEHGQAVCDCNTKGRENLRL
tara:strand:- start:149 stop:592 length:444 start_codon:yes stop_codon:yes gene_type:complete